MALTAGQLLVRLGIDSSLGADMNQAERQLQSSTARMERWVRRGMAAIGTAIASAAAASVKFAADYEASLTKINTLVGVSQDQVEAWGESLQALAGEVGRGPRELADALFVVTSAGQRGAEALEIVEQAAKASALGLGETESVARAVTAAMNAYGAETLSASQATDILRRIVKAGNLEAESLAPVLGRVIGIAAELGVSFEDLGANIATFTRLGVDSAEAVTGLRAVLTALLAPGKQAKDALEAVGLSAGGLREQLREKGLQSVLETLVDTFGDNTEALAAVIPNVRALSNVLGTAGSQAETYRQVLAEVADTTDTVDDAFQTLERTTQFQFQKARANAEALLITLGSRVLPVLNDALTSFTDLVEAGDAFSDALSNVKKAADPLFDSVHRLKEQAFGPFDTLLTTLANTSLPGAREGAAQLREEIGRLEKEAKKAEERDFFQTLYWAVLGRHIESVTGTLDLAAEGLNAVFAGDSFAGAERFDEKVSAFTETLGDFGSAAVQLGVDIKFDLDEPLKTVTQTIEDAGEPVKKITADFDAWLYTTDQWYLTWGRMDDLVTASIRPLKTLVTVTGENVTTLSEWREEIIKTESPLERFIRRWKEFSSLGGLRANLGNLFDISFESFGTGLLSVFSGVGPQLTNMVAGFFTDAAERGVRGFVSALGRALSGTSSQDVTAQGILRPFHDAMVNIANTAKVLGDEYDRQEAEMSLIKQTMVDLLNAGVLPSHEAYVRLEEILRLVTAGTHSYAEALLEVLGVTLRGNFGLDALAENTDFDWAQGLADLFAELGITGDELADALADAVVAVGELRDGFGTWVDAVEEATEILINEWAPAVEGIGGVFDDAVQALGNVADQFSEVDPIMERLGNRLNNIRARFEEGLLTPLERAEEMVRVFQNALVALNEEGLRGTPIYEDLRTQLAEWLAVVASFADEVSAPPPLPVPPPGGGAGGGGGEIIPQPAPGPGITTIRFPAAFDLKGSALSLLTDLRTIARNQLAATILAASQYSGSASERLRAFLGDVSPLGLGDPFDRRLAPARVGGNAPAINVNAPGASVWQRQMIEEIAEQVVLQMLSRRR